MKFAVDEVAVFCGCSLRNLNPFVPLPGDYVTIVRVGPFPSGVSASGRIAPGLFSATQRTTDYEVVDIVGHHWFCTEDQLRKLRPPGAELVKKFLENLPRLVEETA